MRAWFFFLPILLFAQSSSPPSKRVPIDNAVPAAKGTKDGAPKKAEAKPQAPSPVTAPAQAGSDESQQATQPSPPSKSAEVTTDPIVRYTFWLVIVGGLQFLALIVQAFFLWKAFTETTTATGLTAQALAEAQRSNAANEKLTLESNANARDATEATRQSLILTHRPKLIVRNVVVKQPTSLSFMARGGVNNRTPINGQFYVANIGGTPARIVEYFSMLGRGALPMERPYETLDGSPSDFQLLPGESAPIPFPTNLGEFFDGGESVIQASGGWTGYIMGWIQYRDDAGNLRRTAFCRGWNLVSQRFYAVEDADYEHAE